MRLLSSLCLSSLALTAIAAPPQISADLHEITNYKTFAKSITLSAPHKAALRKNGFFTCPSKDEALYWGYGQNDYENIPSIVTTDNLLQIYHIFFDSTLRAAEEKRLLPDLSAMTTGMLKQSLATLASVRGTGLESAALKNAAYFTVAATLLGLKPNVGADVMAMANVDVARVSAHEGFAKGGIFPYDVDYSQFIVRGHYSKTPGLGKYFQTMMWYGLVPFAAETLANGQRQPNPEQVEQALLISHDLETSGMAARWEKLYDVTALFAGKANDATPPEWATTSKSVYGDDLRSYADPQKMASFLATIRKVHPPLIVTKRTKGEVASPLQFRFMGQRAIPDSYVMQELSDPNERPFPSPLDIFSVLGSARATAILDADPAQYNAKHWADYQPSRTRLHNQFGALPPATWHQDLYWSWLHSLKSLLTPLPDSAPGTMRTAAWSDMQLCTALGSWAELRHDTILYGLQSVSEMGDGGEEQPYVKGYVEPNIEFYTRLDAMVKQIRDAMKSRGYLDGDTGTQYARFLELISFFKGVSQKELAGHPVAKADHWRIRKIEGELESLHNTMQMMGANFQQLTQDDMFNALIADVHTADGQALEVGIGCADHLIAAIPIEGKLVLGRGTKFSYYEFRQPISDRLTDEKWKARLREGKVPQRPIWTRSFFVPEPIKEKS